MRKQEITIDSEYHSYHPYSGFVCLMQISTRDEDWIVDPFVIRDELEDLNEVFTNPNIVKTGGATRDVPQLLSRYCKRYQLADWRIRRNGHTHADPRFLLYIYDNLRNALFDSALSHSTSPTTSRAGSPTATDAFVCEGLSRSAETALCVYAPDLYDAEGGTGFNG
ncbi:ribonuclease H-like domain-containing protein [Lactarius quietus]|nr:ribonuclease H-like domain-containing protein [Lactarius quietus]